MAIRNIRMNEDPILRKKCKKVEVIDEKIQMILDDMLETLHQTGNGVAIAANQVGVLKRLIVIDYCGQLLRLINPEIVESSGEQECVEGCLSFPNRYVKTIRPKKVTIRALNEQGEVVVIDGEDELAKCFCHELGHLDGEIFLDKSIGELELGKK